MKVDNTRPSHPVLFKASAPHSYKTVPSEEMSMRGAPPRNPMALYRVEWYDTLSVFDKTTLEPSNGAVLFPDAEVIKTL